MILTPNFSASLAVCESVPTWKPITFASVFSAKVISFAVIEPDSKTIGFTRTSSVESLLSSAAIASAEP